MGRERQIAAELGCIDDAARPREEDVEIARLDTGPHRRGRLDVNRAGQGPEFYARGFVEELPEARQRRAVESLAKDVPARERLGVGGAELQFRRRADAQRDARLPLVHRNRDRAAFLLVVLEGGTEGPRKASGELDIDVPVGTRNLG